MKRVFIFLTLTAILSVIPASAYYHFIYYLNSGRAVEKFDLAALPAKTVTFFVSESGPTTFAANDNFASVIGQIRHATQVWNSVSSSDLRVAFGGLENTSTLQNTPAGDVVFEDLPPGVFGYGTPTVTTAPVIPANGAPFVPIRRSVVRLNLNLATAPGPSYEEAFFMTVVHEMGHALGLQHTFTSSTMSTATTRSTSLAHPLEDDDIAGISSLYPTAAFAQLGSITGTITSNGSGVHLASVVALRAGVEAVSALTNPDGTYRIDGVTPGQYYVYAHALPPDADIQGPWDARGSVVAASGPTNALFYPGTMNLGNANPISVQGAKSTDGIDIALAARDSLPIYDVSVYGYFNDNTVAIKPAYVNMQGIVPVTVVASGAGLGADGQAPGLSAHFAGGSAIVIGDPNPYQVDGSTYIALSLGYQLGATPGPEHLIFTTPDFMHVLPSAVRVTQAPPPAIQSVTTNADGTLTVSGTNWTTGSAIYFDSLPATVANLTLDKKNAGTAIVTPPAGTKKQTAILTVYNPDGQNSQFVQSDTPVTYTYGDAPTATIVSISPASLPAGAEAVVDITGSGLNFTSGQTAVGFGTSDVVVRNVFVLSPDHLQVNVSVAAGAALSHPDVSVFNGFRMATAPAGFSVTAAVKGLPAPIPQLFNALPGLNGQYAGATVALYGANLAAANATPVVTFNGETAAILYSSPTQINLQIPGDLAPGLTVMQLNNGAVSAYPVEVNIDTLPARITAVQNTNGDALSASIPAAQGNLLTVTLSGFAQNGRNIELSEVQAGVGGLIRAPLTVTEVPSTASGAATLWQVTFLLAPDEPLGRTQSLIIYLDGRSSYPATIPVATSTGSFTTPAGN